MGQKAKVTEKSFAVVVVINDKAVVYESEDRKKLAAKVRQARRKGRPFAILSTK